MYCCRNECLDNSSIAAATVLSACLWTSVACGRHVTGAPSTFEDCNLSANQGRIVCCPHDMTVLQPYDIKIQSFMYIGLIKLIDSEQDALYPHAAASIAAGSRQGRCDSTKRVGWIQYETAYKSFLMLFNVMIYIYIYISCLRTE